MSEEESKANPKVKPWSPKKKNPSLLKKQEPLRPTRSVPPKLVIDNVDANEDEVDELDNNKNPQSKPTSSDEKQGYCKENDPHSPEKEEMSIMDDCTHNQECSDDEEHNEDLQNTDDEDVGDIEEDRGDKENLKDDKTIEEEDNIDENNIEDEQDTEDSKELKMKKEEYAEETDIKDKKESGRKKISSRKKSPKKMGKKEEKNLKKESKDSRKVKKSKKDLPQQQNGPKKGKRSDGEEDMRNDDDMRNDEDMRNKDDMVNTDDMHNEEDMPQKEDMSNLTKKPKPNMRRGDSFPKPKKRYPSFLQNLADYFSEYCDNTSIHGFKYLGEQKRNFIEKIWWILFCVTSLVLCMGLITNVYEKWEFSPVLVSFAKSPTPIGQIPFPAVTICPEVKARQRIFNYTDYYYKLKDNKTLTDEEKSKLHKILITCNDSIPLEERKLTTSYDTVDFLAKVAPPFHEVLMDCSWRNNTQDKCGTLFSTLLTEDGVCFTFNMLNSKEIFTKHAYHHKHYTVRGKNSLGWSLESGFAPDSDFPRRAETAGANTGLNIILKTHQEDIDYLCRENAEGFRVLLHHPGEVPRTSMQYFRAGLDQETIVAVKPDMITTSKSLESYKPNRRQCYFSSERQLLFYRTYTQKNCEVECLANLTLSLCGCVAYYMPHEPSAPICGAANNECVDEASHEVLKRESDSYEDSDKCNCLPSCTSLVYNTEFSQAYYDWRAVFQALGKNSSEKGVHLTRLTIFFKHLQFITLERNELYGITDFLASCGGLLGLFTGFSFLSLLEIIYFLTLRMMCNWKNHGRHYWSGSPDLVEDDSYDHPEDSDY